MQQITKQKLDFRFADEMDGMDIVQFVNGAYAIECQPESSVCFRKEGPKVQTEEVESDLLAMPIKWLVLETPMPEELIVGAARLKYDAARNGRVDIFCVANSSSTTNTDALLSIAKQLLSKIETVCYSIGLRSCIMEAPQWRTDLEELFTSCGYEEMSGHVWPEEKQHELVKPTMVLEYHKIFSAKNINTANNSMLLPTREEVPSGNQENNSESSADLAADLVNQLSALNDLTIASTGTNSGTSQGETPALFESLFAALHAEYGADGGAGGV